MHSQAVEDQAHRTRIQPRRPTCEEQRAFGRFGSVEVPDLWSHRMRTAIATEAEELFPESMSPVGGPRTPVADHRRTGKVTKVASGPVLEGLHVALASFVRALTGQLLVVSFANYGYYPTEDGVILHCDTDRTDVVLLTTALGHIGPLQVRPELRGLTATELGERESDPAWDREGGYELMYPSLGVAAMRGAELPHHRISTPVASVSAVAAMHYRLAY